MDYLRIEEAIEGRFPGKDLKVPVRTLLRTKGKEVRTSKTEHANAYTSRFLASRSLSRELSNTSGASHRNVPRFVADVEVVIV
jgi:hypothetical protein